MMDRSTYAKYHAIQELALSDPQYQQILAEYRALDQPMRDLWARLPEPDVDIIMGYIGAVGAAGMKLLEIAYENMEFPE